MLKFPEFERGVRKSAILQRGRSYFEHGLVSDIEETGEGQYYAHVKSDNSNDRYAVKIMIARGKVTSNDCSCPFSGKGVCKHIVCVLFKIKHDSIQRQNEPSESNEESRTGNSKNNAKSIVSNVFSKNDPEIFKILEEHPDNKPQNLKKVKQADKSKTKKKGNQLNDPNDIKVNNPEVTLPPNRIEKEFECQVCLDRYTNPVLMPCHVHSVCLRCFHGMYLKKKEEAPDRILQADAFCPTCGIITGSSRFGRFKINKGLIKIMDAYQKEKRANQEMKVKQQLNQKLAMLEYNEKKCKTAFDKSTKEKIKLFAVEALKLIFNNQYHKRNGCKLLTSNEIELNAIMVTPDPDAPKKPKAPRKPKEKKSKDASEKRNEVQDKQNIEDSKNDKAQKNQNTSYERFKKKIEEKIQHEKHAPETQKKVKRDNF